MHWCHTPPPRGSDFHDHPLVINGGVDLVGPFLPEKGGVKFMIIAINYFTKWAEVEPLATIMSKAVTKFLLKNIIYW